ncbi:MAG: PKD domain-containing protein [Flavobacteriales bacterium]|nr:PKD domain-containing protein [Flavobacteriales bacterium]
MITLGLLAQAGMAQQEFPISGGDVTTCAGVLLDTGGQSGAYGNNENHTITICPDESGPAITLNWLVFSLSTEGIAPIDAITIYDGDSSNAPEIGTWNGNTAPGVVAASFENPTGCLTVVFTSNNTGTGNFAAAVTCFTPCAPPTAAASFGSEIPLLACQGETIDFDGSASAGANGAVIEQYLWDFADGAVDSLSGPLVQHAFEEAGEYVVQLYVTDEHGCLNTNLVDLQVLVSTTPSFAGTVVSPLTICEGETVDLTAQATGTTWSALPESNLGGGVALPDGSGVSYTSVLTFTNFLPGQTITDPNTEILAICAELEHSYMGDLVISITCPNGQSMTMHEQGGGSTYLGAANDTDSGNNPILGECWDYCWSPTATLGTFAQCAQFGATPNVTTAGQPAWSALLPGTYSSVQPWSSLAGCPLNGSWTFTVTDMWAIDNGFICSWALDFDPSLFPSLTEFTPVPGLSTTDSSAWAGNGFVPQPGDHLSGTATPVGVGTHDYVFTVTDDFGCAYDTTITVTVNPGIEGPLYITGDPVICGGDIILLQGPPGYDTYTWDNGSFGQTITAFSPGTFIVTVALGDCSLPSEPFTVTVADDPEPVITGPMYSCDGDPVVLTTTEPYAAYQWGHGPETAAVSVGTGMYTVTVTSAEGCTGTSAPFSVTVGNTPTAGIHTDPTSPQPPGTNVHFFDASDGNGSVVTGWEWTFGPPDESSTEQDPEFTYDLPGTYPVSLIVTTAEGCTDTVAINYIIIPDDVEIPNVFTPNGDGMNDFLVFANVQYYANHLTVFNRWGQAVYEQANYMNNWRATDMPEGTYFFVLKLIEEDREVTGHVTILREYGQ